VTLFASLPAWTNPAGHRPGAPCSVGACTRVLWSRGRLARACNRIERIRMRMSATSLSRGLCRVAIRRVPRIRKQGRRLFEVAIYVIPDALHTAERVAPPAPNDRARTRVVPRLERALTCLAVRRSPCDDRTLRRIVSPRRRATVGSIARGYAPRDDPLSRILGMLHLGIERDGYDRDVRGRLGARRCFPCRPRLLGGTRLRLRLARAPDREPHPRGECKSRARVSRS